MPRRGSIVTLLAVAVIAFACGFATAWWFTKESIREANAKAEAEVARARQAADEIRQEAEELADELDLQEEELWTALADRPAPKSEPGAGQELSGKVVSVADGDTITVLDATKTQHRIRLLGIDTPEKKQPFSTKAKEVLSAKVFGKDVRVKWSKKDRYGRALGDVYVGDDWINRDLVREGLAWHYKHYDKRAELDTAEQEARKAKSGLWVEDKPEAPWDYRARMRKPRPPPPEPPAQKPNGKTAPAPALTHWLNSASGVRHNSGCRWFHNTKEGRPCRPDEGRGCKICGG